MAPSFAAVSPSGWSVAGSDVAVGASPSAAALPDGSQPAGGNADGAAAAADPAVALLSGKLFSSLQVNSVPPVGVNTVICHFGFGGAGGATGMLGVGAAGARLPRAKLVKNFARPLVTVLFGLSSSADSEWVPKSDSTVADSWLLWSSFSLGPRTLNSNVPS